VRLRANELKRRAEEAGLTPEALGQAIERTGLKGADTAKAVRNWMAGRDHPRAKKPDVVALATALGCSPKDIAKFTSMVRHHRGSPRKAKLVVDLVRGKPVDQALNLLTFSTKRAATNLRKALSAAIAEAELNDADISRLYVSESRVDGATHIKRFQPKDRGRAHQILKRTSHITISVEERA
jgi:large subunit ribosomal protein L22